MVHTARSVEGEELSVSGGHHEAPSKTNISDSVDHSVPKRDGRPDDGATENMQRAEAKTGMETKQPEGEKKEDTDDAAQSQLTAEEPPNANDTEETAFREISRVQAALFLGGSSFANLLEDERREGRFDLRMHQALLHEKLSFERMVRLEKSVRDLESKVYNTESTWREGKNVRKFPIHKHILQRSGGLEFRVTWESVRQPVTEQPALEVALENMTGSVYDASKGEGRKSSTIDQYLQMYPKRLRIRSRPLLYHLEQILGLTLLNQVPEETLAREFKTVYPSMVFLWPFKLFFLREDEIRQSHRELEEKIFLQSQDDLEHSQEHSGLLTHKPLSQNPFFATDDLRKDLRLLIEFLDVDLKRAKTIRECVVANQDCEVEYQDLWHIFNPGDIIIPRHEPTHAFRLLNVTGGRDVLQQPVLEQREQRTDGFVLDCYSFTNDGTSYVPIISKFRIRQFYGRQNVSDLPYMPLRLHPKADQLTAEYTASGRLYVEITRQPFRHMLAKGKTLDEPAQVLNTQVIVDMALALQSNTDWLVHDELTEVDLTQADERETREKSYCGHSAIPCCGGDMIHRDQEIDKLYSDVLFRSDDKGFQSLTPSEVTDSHYILMQPHVHAFVLRQRQWVTLSVSDLHPVVFSNTFENLKIPEKHKIAVQALVRTHEAGQMETTPKETRSIGSAMDLVAGKGRGLIILLHGPPGVGKTSTAECVADTTRRPLYPITSGDIGETAVEVEKNLHRSFQFAQKWGCVLLLDEADVFLTKRTKFDLRHNAVTSVFLRSLEYYSGILFLTTNRVGVMDLAFKSRIQMTLWYPKLERAVTLDLYRMFINRAKKEQEEQNSYRFKIKEKEILQFAAKHFDKLERDGLDTWNGRQIRNAFQTAIALVEHESTMQDEDEPLPKLGKRQFKTVADGSRQFDEYLTVTTGKTETDAARMDAWRNDTFSTGRTEHASGHSPRIRAVWPDQKGSESGMYLGPEASRSAKVPAIHEPDSSSGESSEDDSDSDSGSSSNESTYSEDKKPAGKKKKKQMKRKSENKGKSSTNNQPTEGKQSGGHENAGAEAPMSTQEQFQQFLEWQKKQQQQQQ